MRRSRFHVIVALRLLGRNTFFWNRLLVANARSMLSLQQFFYTCLLGLDETGACCRISAEGLVNVTDSFHPLFENMASPRALAVD